MQSLMRCAPGGAVLRRARAPVGAVASHTPSAAAVATRRGALPSATRRGVSESSPAQLPACTEDAPSAIGLSAFAATLAVYLGSTGPALADPLGASNPFEGVQANSLYVTLALFVMSVPGIWSQVKRAPKASVKRKTFEVAGPGREGAMPMDDRARQIFSYFKKYNYEIQSTGEVITFAGLYAADKGQAAAVTFYTFFGMGSIALVLSILSPDIGNWWYLLTLLSPGAYIYYMSRGTRKEEVKVKMVTADNDQTTDITVEGDIEEILRMARELDLVEKGMVRVKGILEQA